MQKGKKYQEHYLEKGQAPMVPRIIPIDNP
jgi:hypothetical protein